MEKWGYSRRDLTIKETFSWEFPRKILDVPESFLGEIGFCYKNINNKKMHLRSYGCPNGVICLSPEKGGATKKKNLYVP